MTHPQQTLVITGASGFIGRYLVLALCDRFQLYCLARRSQAEVGIQYSPNIHWIQADIADQEDMRRTSKIIHPSNIDAVLHLAGYYDFSQQENPAYEATNVTGTRNIMDLAHVVGAKHFIFSSSLAACEFTPPGRVIDESTPVSAEFPYARSKRQAEEIIRRDKKDMQVCIARLAAVYSDWCEFPPLYTLLETWLSRSIVSRAIGGKGEFAIPYIHINDVIDAFVAFLDHRSNLPAFGIYNISPQGSTTHKTLFESATRYTFGRVRKMFHVPRLLAWGSLHLQVFWFALKGKTPLERPWMARYIDKKLNVQADRTYQRLGWKPTPRYHILRRLLFLLENKRAHPNNWKFRNESMIYERMPERRSMLIHKALQECRNEVIEETLSSLLKEIQNHRFPRFKYTNQEVLHWFSNFIFQVLRFSIITRDRYILSEAIQVITPYCFIQGYTEQELKDFMLIFQQTMIAHLLTKQDLKRHAERIHDFIHLNMQFIVDEIEETYESLGHQDVVWGEAVKKPPEAELHEIYRFVRRMEGLCGESMVDIFLPRQPPKTIPLSSR